MERYADSKEAMQSKFTITFDDGTTLESHDENWVQVLDHCHALQSGKKWITYQIIFPDNYSVLVDFRNGEFIVAFNGFAQKLLPGGWDGLVLTGRQVEYVPIFGMRRWKGESIDADVRFCGWKANIDGTAYKKVAYVFPTKEVLFE